MSRKTADKRKKAKKKTAGKNKQSSFVDIARSLNRATKLHQAGKLAAARKIYQQILAYDPHNYDALQLLGAIDLAQGNNDKAVEYISRALTVRSDLPVLHYNKGVALMNLGQIREGVDSLRRALDLDSDFLLANYMMGKNSLAVGFLEDAIMYLDKANSLRPHHQETVVMLANALVQDDRVDQAESLIRNVDFNDAEKAHLFYRVGVDLRPVGRWDLSLLMLEKAFELAQGDEVVVTGLVEGLERVSRLQDAFEIIQAYINKNEQCSISLAVILVRILRRMGRLEEAKEEADKYLGRVEDTQKMAELNKEVGMIYDRQGNYSSAWESFTISNKIMKSQAQEQGISYSAMPEIIQRSHDWCADATLYAADSANSEERAVAPVFFCGFPRSGTTLMGHMLSRHPKITTTDEVPTLNRMADSLDELIGREVSYLDDLHTLSAAEIEHLKKLYWSKLGVDPGQIEDGCVVVDKMPLNFLYLPFALRLFPEAKVLFSLRDPRDVCLSCYMQFFDLNPSMVQFHEIRSTIEMYKLSMGLWEEYKVKLNPNYYEYRYEGLVNNPHAELSAILDFINVDWDEVVLMQGGDVNQSVSTPSYESIVRPINTSAVSRWCNYEEYLHPVIDELRPFVRLYGY